MGRTKARDYADEWNPPAYTVDERSRVVGGYEPREPNNWGRWGEDDQRGTQNLIGDEERAAARRARALVFSRALPIDVTAPSYSTRPAPLRIPFMTGSDAVVGSPYGADRQGFQWSDDMLQMSTQAPRSGTRWPT